MVTKMGFRQNGTFASKKEADDEEIGYHLVGPGLYLFTGFKIFSTRFHLRDMEDSCWKNFEVL